MRDFANKIDNTAPSPSGILTAAEDMVRFNELKSAVSTAAITLDPAAGPDADLTMLAQAMARYASGGQVYDCAGAANAYTLTGKNLFVVPKSPFDGQLVLFLPSATNNSASTATFAGVTKAIRSYADTALVGGELVIERPTACVYKASANSGAGALLVLPWALPGSASVLAPIYPEITSTNNVLTFTSTTGQIVVDGGLGWVWRGALAFTSAAISAPDRTFATSASKTYHLMWDAPGTGNANPAATYPAGRFSLIDRTSASPAETDSSYDTTYDRMLVAKVATNGSNVLTVTALKNKARLVLDYATAILSPLGESYEDTKVGASITGGTVVTLDWSRKALGSLTNVTDMTTSHSTVTNAGESNLGVHVTSRYSARLFSQYTVNSGNGYAIAAAFIA